MNLMDELVEAYLDNNFEHPYFLDLQTGQVIPDLDETYTGEPGIDWDDEENEERYEPIPKITSDEAYGLMVKFARQMDSNLADKLFNALDRPKPFRRFRDMLFELDLRDEWNSFERKMAEEEINSWIEQDQIPYELLNKKYQKSMDF